MCYNFIYNMLSDKLFKWGNSNRKYANISKGGNPMGKPIEYKDKVGGPELGKPRREVTYFSPRNGISVLPEDDNSCELIKEMEENLGIRSWIDNR